jgi:dTDP-4-dehydrorhamnose reductase
MIVVTGASGLLGVSVLTLARDRGREAVGICHRNLLRVPGTRISEVDLTNRQAVRTFFEPLQPESIIHCAAATDVDWCEDHPELAEQVNVQASSFLAEIAHELNARFVYISTDSVFDGKRGNYSETDQPAPGSVYAKSKWRGEQEVLRRHSSPLIVRVNIYGWNAQPKHSLAEWVLDEIRAGKQVRGFADVYFCPLLANDLAEVLLTMLDRGFSGLYHVVSSERISKYDFVRRVALTFNLGMDCVEPISILAAKLRAPRPIDPSLSTEKIRVALGRPMPDVDTGLRRFRDLHESGYHNQLKSFLVGHTE